MKKSKLALLLVLVALSCACVESFISVPVPFNEKKVADFAAFQDLFFIDFLCDVPDAGFDAPAEVRRAFIEEISFATGKKITLLEPEQWATIRGLLQRYRLAAEIQYENSIFFQKVFRAHPRSLFFTGKLKLDIKKMGVVKETRDEKGNKKNAYETMQLWEMEVKASLIDGDTAKVVWKETFSEKSEPGPETTAQFNFNSMFAKITVKLANAMQPRQAQQDRYILVK